MIDIDTRLYKNYTYNTAHDIHMTSSVDKVLII